LRCRNKFRDAESRMHKRCNKIGIIWASTEFILCLMILNNNFIQAISLFYYNSFISSLCSYVHMFIIKFLFSYHICCSFFLFSAMPSMLLCSARIALRSWSVCRSHQDTCLISIFCYHLKMMTMIFVIFGIMRNQVNLSNCYFQYEASITPQNVINSIISKSSLIGLILLSICLWLRVFG